VVAALHSTALGRYVPSRVPGFPVFDGLLVMLLPLRHLSAPLGWIATNGAAIVAAIAAVIYFRRVALRLRPRHAAWLTLACAFGAPLWVRVSQTMDYAFGLAFLLAAYDALLARRAILSGMLFAFATGCRPSNSLFLLPVALYLLLSRVSRREWIAFGASYALVCASLFTPVFLAVRGSEMSGSLAYHVAAAHATWRTLPALVRGGAVFALGKFGVCAAALGALARVIGLWRHRAHPTGARAHHRTSTHERGNDAPALAFEIASILAVAGFYLLIPYEDAYLLPLVPFALLVASRAIEPRWTAVMALAIALEPLVSIQLDTRRIVPGELFIERATRRHDLDTTRRLMVLHPARPTIYVIGRFNVLRLLVLDATLAPTPAGWAAFHAPGVALWRADHRVGYASELEPADRARLVRTGWTVVDTATP
jgi:hypothetical protein